MIHIGHSKAIWADRDIRVRGESMVAWPVNVNQKAYGMEKTQAENVERIEFESGRARTYLKNSKATNIFSFLLTFEDHTGAGSEYKRFLDWWDNSLHGLAGSFEFPDLITHTGTKEYRAIEDYNVTGQKFKEVSLTVEEL